MGEAGNPGTAGIAGVADTAEIGPGSPPAPPPLIPQPGGPGLLRSLLGGRGAACREAGGRVRLPAEVRESSGVAPAAPVHREAPPSGTFWTHNDSGWPAEIFRVGSEGQLLDAVQVTGARNVDWEAMAAGPCPGREGERCLYLADVGDNRETRASLALYRVPEPAPGATTTAPATRFPLVLPHGPRDIEAVALLPGEHFLLFTKGRNHPVEVYRIEGPLGDDPRPLEPERMALLTPRPPGFRDMVTGAAATRLPSGRLALVVRTYQSMAFYEVEVDATGRPHTLLPVAGSRVNLLPLREPQGEAVGFMGGGRMVLTSEGGPTGGPASLRIVDCSAGFERWWPAPLPGSSPHPQTSKISS